MQIVSFPASIAVLLFAAIFFLGKFAELHSSPVSSQQDYNNAFNSKESSASNQEMSVEDEANPVLPNSSIVTLRPWLNIRQSEELLFLEGGGDTPVSVDCCPSVLEMTAPDGGINTEGNYVQLYNDGSKRRQQFYEISCKTEVLDQPCRFMERRFHNRSRCVQKYSYSYAIVVQPPNTVLDPTKQAVNHQFPPLFDNHSKSDKYMLDYIQIRSGCSCEITPSKKLHKKSAKGKKKKRKPANEGESQHE